MELLISMPGGAEWIIILSILIIPVVALIDIVRSQFEHPNDRLLWVVIVLLLPFIGSVLYMLFGRPRRLR